MNKFKTLLLGLYILLAFYVTMNLLTINAFGEQYKFNMTRELKEEGRVLQICIETDVVLDFCNTRYGGIHTTYGEAVK